MTKEAPPPLVALENANPSQYTISVALHVQVAGEDVRDSSVLPDDLPGTEETEIRYHCWNSANREIGCYRLYAIPRIRPSLVLVVIEPVVTPFREVLAESVKFRALPVQVGVPVAENTQAPSINW